MGWIIKVDSEATRSFGTEDNYYVESYIHDSFCVTHKIRKAQEFDHLAECQYIKRWLEHFPGTKITITPVLRVVA